LTLLIAPAAMERLGGAGLLATRRSSFYLPSDLLVIIIALREMKRPCESLVTYRAAKCIELLCEAIRLFREGKLHPMVGDATLSSGDTRRIFAARRMIDERWNEKLTLEGVSRACGINRAKLTRGFKMVFDCTIAEAIAERRFVQASRLLLTTDFPVYRVGYESGYQNNASFARAFSRHFGVSPTDYRTTGIAA
jgi:AraC family transcriptional activator of pyochelin receptor